MNPAVIVDANVLFSALVAAVPAFVNFFCLQFHLEAGSKRGASVLVLTKRAHHAGNLKLRKFQKFRLKSSWIPASTLIYSTGDSSWQFQSHLFRPKQIVSLNRLLKNHPFFNSLLT
jgi:hypothetical protein